MKFVKKKWDNSVTFYYFRSWLLLQSIANTAQPAYKWFRNFIFLIRPKSSQWFLVAIAHIERLMTETRKEMERFFYVKIITRIFQTTTLL